MTRSLTGDRTRDLQHSVPLGYRRGGQMLSLLQVLWRVISYVTLTRRVVHWF